MGFRYKISTWFDSHCIIDGCRHLPGDLFQMLTTNEMNGITTIEEIKQLARLDWDKPAYRNKKKRLQIFENEELVYLFDSVYGEWKPKEKDLPYIPKRTKKASIH